METYFSEIGNEAWYIPLLLAAGSIACKFLNAYKAKRGAQQPPTRVKAGIEVLSELLKKRKK